MKNQEKEFKVIFGVICFALIVLLVVNYMNKLEQEKVDLVSIEFLNYPQDQIIDTTYFILKGKISDSTVNLKVDNAKLLSNSNGIFTILLENKFEPNSYFEVIVTSGSSSKRIKEHYKVKFNSLTKKYLEDLRIQELEIKKNQEREEYLTNVKIYGKKAARIKKTHPDWAWDDCRRLAQNKIWIGMDIRMLIFLRGRDFRRNVSNYGNGNQYQYCWSDYDISCFYDNNDDGKIDSYN